MIAKMRSGAASLWDMIPREYHGHAKATGVLGVAVFCAAPVRVLVALGQLVWTCIGTMLGVGLGLGLALHVYEQLQTWNKAQDLQKKQFSLAHGQSSSLPVAGSATVRGKTIGETMIRPRGNMARAQSSVLEDSSSYLALMASAGYMDDEKVLRGQVLKGDASFWDVKYRFTDVTVERQRGPQLLRADWPGLPEPITRELGRFVEHVMRDYVSGWYSRLDSGCIYKDEKTKRLLGIQRDGNEPAVEPLEGSSPEQATEQQSEATRQQTAATPHHNIARKMVFSTLTHRNIPMLDQTYRVLSATFGSLATRAEQINVFSLAFLKWTQVLGHTFKQYRNLRRLAEEKNQTESPTEIQIIREFMLAGKLHKAITFGLDVPSLLFADALGTECGCGTGTTTGKQTPQDASQVLEERLFGTPMLKECELDYNRVVAFRLVRALLPRNESSSNVVMALVTEIMGACVLQPLMNLWIPSFLNELIVNAMTPKQTEECADESTPGLTEEETIKSTGDGADVNVHAPVSELLSNAGQDTEGATNSRPSGSSFVPSMDMDSSDEKLIEASQSVPLSTLTADSRSRLSSTDATTSNGSYLADEEVTERNRELVGDLLLKLSAIAIKELQRYVDLQECRIARLNNRENSVDYDDPSCQEAVLRLVLIVEAALLQGRCNYRYRTPSNPNDQSTSPIPADPQEAEPLSQVLMEMTSDMTAFEKRIEVVRNQDNDRELFASNSDADFVPDQNEISTLRTLISTWMHTGQLARAIHLVIKGMDNVLLPYYTDNAFLAVSRNALAFQQQMDLFDKVDVMVETMAVLASPRLDIEAEALLIPRDEFESDQVQERAGKNSRLSGINDDNGSPSVSDLMAHNFGTASTPRYLDFHKNAAFAASLRSERERRLRSWESQKSDEPLQPIHRPGASPSDIELHNELHSLARIFYNGTNVMTIRDAARRSDPDENETKPPQTTSSDTGKVSLIAVETVSNRRRIEVPDDDSSFLLRAQPRPLNPVSVHRDDRNHDLSYKCFLATYEEPAIQTVANRSVNPGRYVRRCFLQYYPIDRTATIMLHNDARKLDRRKGKPWVNDQPALHHQPSPYLPGAFLRERHLCQKWTQKGSSAQSFLSSSVIEPSDFNAVPRSGRALDFVYRMSLFERPIVDLAGKRFTVQDSAGRGHHRSDASSLEVSDASLSALLLGIGKDVGREEGTSRAGTENSEYRHRVEMGPDGYPVVFMKFNRQSSADTSSEIKPYRLSFVRAALLITSSRQEAQLQCLIDCVKAGSAKSATKARTDAQLKPTMKILEHANDRTSERLRESILLRDLKLGVYHIDREQLRRNGLLNPRFPTSICELNASVEGPVQARDVAELASSSNVPPTSTLYKIRCVASVELATSDDDTTELEPYLCEDGTLASQYREEWVIYRSMKDFQAFHKHLKSEIANAEASASAGSRLVGAATAAFSSATLGRRNRKSLIPSLAQASKTGAIAVTQKAIVKRGELLGEYLDYLLAPGHVINRCMELMLFLGASFPFPSEVHVTKKPIRLVDPLGRTNFTRLVAAQGVKTSSPRRLTINQNASSITRLSSNLDDAFPISAGESENMSTEKSDDSDLIDSILNKVDQVPLSEVRNRLVELVKYQFGFENASFFRSRLLSALETASFVAMTKGSEFRMFLYRAHLQHLSPEAIAALIEKVLDILWPDGCWLVPRPALTQEEEDALKEGSRQILHERFPEQIRAILGKELTRDGLDMLHEMLQNRLVMKSLFYMLFDLLWIEVFPELRDALPCASALDID